MEHGRLLCTIVLGAGLLIGCTPRVQQPGVPSPAPAGEEIRISRGPCFGFCPVYTVAVTPAGRVDFKGERHTAVLGERAHSVGPAVYGKVREALQPLRPGSATEQDFVCSVQATDMARLTVEWVSANGTRTAFHYDTGCRDEEGARIARTIEEQVRRLEVDGWATQKTWPGDTRG